MTELKQQYLQITKEILFLLLFCNALYLHLYNITGLKKDYMDKIPSIIANLRKEKNWSHTDLAKQSGLSHRLISKYEKGIATPSVDAAKKIADAFGVSLDYLVGEGINSSFDIETLKRLQEIQSMKPDYKTHLFSIIDGLIRDYKTQQT